MTAQTESQFKKWLEFLDFTNDEQKNREILANYFFQKFAASPQTFYEFLQFFRRRIKNNKKLASRFLEILSPLCERFGFFEEKKALDDICFEIHHPEQYQEIDKLLARYKRQSQHILVSIQKILTELLEQKKISATVKGRYKHLYSIFRKMEAKKKDVLSLTDIFAFRIILHHDSTKSCFDSLDLLHDRFHPNPDFFKDYITVPKINGYQSLHTGLFGVYPGLDLPIEIQIRTASMDEFAEQGLAAHWLYSREKRSKLVTEKERLLLSYFSSLSKSTEPKPHIYFFSHTGDLCMLDEGGSVIDFAYRIHTDLGHRAQFALVNGVKKPVSYKILEGDKIEIKKAEAVQINRQWTEFAATKYARSKIADYLKHHEDTLPQIAAH